MAALADLVQRLWHNAGWYARLVADALGGGLWPPAVCYALVVCALWGWWLLRRQADLAAWYLLWYMGVLIAYPWNEGGRFLLPVLPFWWYGVWSAASRGLAAARRTRWPSTARATIIALIGVLLAGQGLLAAWVVRRQHQDFRLPPPEVRSHEPGRHSIQWARVYGADFTQVAGLVRATDAYAMMDWIRRHVHEPAVVLWRARPSIMTLFAGQPSVNYPRTNDPSAWREAVSQPHPVWLLAERYHPAAGHLWPFITAHPELFTPVHTIGVATLYRVATERWPASTSPAETPVP